MDFKQDVIKTLRGLNIPSPLTIEGAFRKMMMEVKGCEPWMIDAFLNTDVWHRTFWTGKHYSYNGQWTYPTRAKKITIPDDRGTRPWEHESVDDIVINFHIVVVYLCHNHPSCHDKFYHAGEMKRVITLRISREHDASDCGRCAELARPAEAPPAPGPTDMEVNACEEGLALLGGILTQRRKYSQQERERAAELIQGMQCILFAHRDVNACSNCGKVPDNNITCKHDECCLPLCDDCAKRTYEVRSLSGPGVRWLDAKKESYVAYECKQYCRKSLCFQCKLPPKNTCDLQICNTCWVWVCAKCSRCSFDGRNYYCKDGTCDLCRTCGKQPNCCTSSRSATRCMCHTCYRCGGWLDFKHPRTQSYKACDCMQKYGLHPGRTESTRDDIKITCRVMTKREGDAMMIDTLAAGGQVVLMDHGVTYQGPTPGATAK